MGQAAIHGDGPAAQPCEAGGCSASARPSAGQTAPRFSDDREDRMSHCQERTQESLHCPRMRDGDRDKHYFQDSRTLSRSHQRPGYCNDTHARARRRCCLRGFRRLGAGSRGLGRGPLSALEAVCGVAGSGAPDAPAPSERSWRSSRRANSGTTSLTFMILANISL